MMLSDVLGGMYEDTANGTIGDWIGEQRAWTSNPERVGTIQGSGERPDILLVQGSRMPVAIECEYDSPAVSDAKRLLGLTLVSETRPFTEVLAVGISEDVKRTTRAALTELLNQNAQLFSVQFVSQKDGEIRVWPATPLPATPNDLIAYCEYAQVPQAVIDARSNEIAEAVRAAGRQLASGISGLPDNLRRDVFSQLREIVGTDTDSAAVQTACAVWLIAIDLQNDLAVHSSVFTELSLLDTSRLTPLTSAKLLESWNIIKGVNYLPVVELAIPSLACIPGRTEGLTDVLSKLSQLSDDLNGLNAKHIYNFAGELWQKLVVDRKERAAHYTKPEVAELLAGLGAMRFADREASELAELDLLDAACGTGTLIGAGERAIRRLHRIRHRGQIPHNLHKIRMENHIIAIDVNGIAGTLTAKRLTDMDVQQGYKGSKIAVTDHEAGSLSLLDPNQTGVSEVLGYRDVIQTSDTQGNLGLFHIGMEGTGVDWSLMNPPYSRPRIGRKQATKGLSRLREKAKKSGYTLSNGQAGLGTDFGNISLMRMKGWGVLSHVLPLTAAYAESWQQWREGIETHFKDIVVIANVGHDEESMSADTEMNEMLVVATKRKGTTESHQWRKQQILCANLFAAPSTLSEGYALANEINVVPYDRDVGISDNFSFTRISIPTPGFPWYGVGNINHEFTGICSALMSGNCWDPFRLTRNPLALDMVTIGDLGEAGPTHHLLGHPANANDAIGAFRWTPIAATMSLSAQRSLWAADSKTQNRIIVQPTHNGEIVDEDLASRMVEKRSQWFVSRNLRWTSQSVAFAKTNNAVHGGNAWNAIQGLADSHGACLTLFYNSIFGAITRQAYAQSTQPGRAMVHVKAIDGLPCPNFGADTPEADRARRIAGMWFDSLSDLELEPFAYCFRDENRHQIDSTVAEMLGLNPNDPDVKAMLAHYRLLFASEPNVNGRNRNILAALKQFGG